MEQLLQLSPVEVIGLNCEAELKFESSAYCPLLPHQLPNINFSRSLRNGKEKLSKEPGEKTPL